MAKHGMVIDLARCMGCTSCMEACKIENNTGKDIFWMYVFQIEQGEYPDVHWIFMPRPCQHCNNAPCVKVCPVGARHQREDGIVLTDFDRCIGCRICVVSCPYSVNYFNWNKPSQNQYYDWKSGEGDNVYGSGSMRDYIGDAIPPYKNPDHEKRYGTDKRLVSGGGHKSGIVEKCTFCVHRVAKGLEPACVANCPVHALHFGDLEDPSSKVSQLLVEKQWFHLLDEAGTKPSVYYIGRPQPRLHAAALKSSSEGVTV